MGKDSTIDELDIGAAHAVIAAEGWPSRDRAPEWLARVLRAGASAMGREVDAAIAAERERIRNGDTSPKSQVDAAAWVGEPDITNTIRWLRAECAGENRHAALYHLIAATRDAAVAAERERCAALLDKMAAEARAIGHEIDNLPGVLDGYAWGAAAIRKGE